MIMNGVCRSVHMCGKGFGGLWILWEVYIRYERGDYGRAKLGS